MRQRIKQWNPLCWEKFKTTGFKSYTFLKKEKYYNALLKFSLEY